ncbi:MAG: glycosyl transferase family 2 [Bacteroidetes bacterium RIFCSPLOWO2_02_FULL_36_8]|nr:MAG: glycosyl transferase family 2 [Bacteroidetes bacterium RIFCSPLOWO2_02_FULL_36_8]OFY69282.1 MAG: glycosyl transferase family 2 [Bacteroidetes bacterium RIFCSPLOWO2_12_FULL_37_12]
MNLSIIIPVYNEEESLKELSAWIERVMNENNLSYEVFFMDDGSTDSSWNIIAEISKTNPLIKGIRFLRNYGKSAALSVGFENAMGDVVFTMDADLQDSPEEIPAMYNMIVKEKYDLVSGWKKIRHDPYSKTLPTRLYNFVTRKMSGIHLHDFNCGLKAYRKEVVKNVEVYGEMHRYIPLIAKWSGFRKIGEKVVKHYPRKFGKTKFGWERFINGFLDFLSISFVTRFEKKPMHFFGTFGTLSFLTGFLISIWLILDKLVKLNGWFGNEISIPRDVTVQPLFYFALVLLIIGTQLFLAGFLGDMISRNSMSRNVYKIAEKTENI